MKIFITGIAGFLGSHLASAMIADGHHVVGIDNMLGGDMENVPEGVQFTIMDCNNLEAVRDVMKGCEVVFHCAATAYEGLSVFSPHLVIQNIVGASTAIFSAAIANRVRRIVMCSSMARYGAGPVPYMESQKCIPQDPYGIGKFATEKLLRNLCDTHGVEYVIAVPHNIIGPRQKYDDPFRNVASIWINLMLQARAPVIYGDGLQTRCFSYISDCLSCLKKMALDPTLDGQTINIGPDEEPVTLNKLFEVVKHVTGFNGEPIYMAGRPQEVRHAVCSSHKARALLGYKTQVTLEEGIFAMAYNIRKRGVRPFVYHLPLEFTTDATPKTWTERLF